MTNCHQKALGGEEFQLDLAGSVEGAAIRGLRCVQLRRTLV